MVVALGGGTAQIAVALEVEFLEVIARVGAGRHFAENPLFGRAMPPSLDRTQIREKIDRTAHCFQRVAETVSRPRVIPGFDVAPVLLDQSPEIGEDAPLVG